MLANTADREESADTAVRVEIRQDSMMPFEGLQSDADWEMEKLSELGASMERVQEMLQITQTYGCLAATWPVEQVARRGC